MQFVPIDALAFGDDNTHYYYQKTTIELRSLVAAYLNGFFPWYESGEPVRYYHPVQRAILEPNQFHCSRSLRKSIQQTGFSCAVDTNFNQVIEQCAACHIERDNSTWITDELQNAFCALHKLGMAHSVEIYINDRLCGGLYGLVLGSVFCGESMFHTITNASKLALCTLCTIALHLNITLIDCQLPTAHLQSLGAITVSRADFLARLANELKNDTQIGSWVGGIASTHTVDTDQLLGML